MKKALGFILAVLVSCSVLGFAKETKTVRVKKAVAGETAGETITKKVKKVSKVKKVKKQAAGETGTTSK